MPFTNTWDKKLVRTIFGKVTASVPTTVYVALSTTTPTQKRSAGTTTWNFTEPSGGSYARVAVSNTTSKWVATTTEPTAGYIIVNHTAITFAAPTGSWGTVTDFGIYTHSSGHTATYLIAFGALTTSKAIGTGDTAPSFAAKALKIKNN